MLMHMIFLWALGIMISKLIAFHLGVLEFFKCSSVFIIFNRREKFFFLCCLDFFELFIHIEKIKKSIKDYTYNFLILNIKT